MQNNADAAVMNFPRRDARDKLLGRTKYTIDVGGSEVIHAVLLRAEVASAQVLRLDVEAARSMPGVRAIATWEDAPGAHGIGIADHPIFARDVIRYHGEPIAAIAAETLEQAHAAAQAITLELAPLPAVLTMAQALEKDAPLVHPDWKDYDILFEGAAAMLPGKPLWHAVTRMRLLTARM